MKSSETAAEGRVLDETVEFSLQQICHSCDVDTEVITAMVTEGIIEPGATGAGDWRFNGVMLKRVQIAVRLQRDLDVNLPGVAVILDLLEELESLRQRQS